MKYISKLCVLTDRWLNLGWGHLKHDERLYQLEAIKKKLVL